MQTTYQIGSKATGKVRTVEIWEVRHTDPWDRAMFPKEAFYYWFCEPGQVPTCEPMGAFASELEALQDAINVVSDELQAEAVIRCMAERAAA